MSINCDCCSKTEGKLCQILRKDEPTAETWEVIKVFELCDECFSDMVDGIDPNKDDTPHKYDN